MLDFQQKRKLRSATYNWVTIGILAVLVLFSVRSVWGVYQKQRESEVLKKQAVEQMATLVARQRELQGDIARLNTPEGVEAEIRSKFDVAKPSENMVIIVDDQASTSTATTPKSLWQKFLDLF